MSYLALDQGTSSSRAIVFDDTGSVETVVQREFAQIYPRPGWVEHDANEIARTQLAVAREAMQGRQIRAIGITNQRETTILWDRSTSQPVANAIVWQDRRTAELCASLKKHEPLVRKKTGLVLDPYFSGTKIRWLLDHIPGARKRAEAGELAFGTVDTWLVWQLTNGRVHVTDATNASRTLVFDIHRRDWDDELLRILEIPRSLLPRVAGSNEVVGETDDGIPISGIAGDQQAALFGQRCVEPGMAKNTYGTGCFIVMNTGGEAIASKHGLLTTVAASENQYALEGSIFIAGAAVQWLRDNLGIIRTAPEIEELASTVEDSGGVTFVPAFTGLGTPHWNPHARAAIVGMTRGTSKGHIARATLEAIALQTAEVLEAMRADSGIALQELRVDGAASTNDLLMQIQADVAGLRVVRPAITETTALGAAYLAGLPPTTWKAQRVFEPHISESERNALRDRWSEAVRKI